MGLLQLLLRSPGATSRNRFLKCSFTTRLRLRRKKLICFVKNNDNGNQDKNKYSRAQPCRSTGFLRRAKFSLALWPQISDDWEDKTEGKNCSNRRNAPIEVSIMYVPRHWKAH